MLDKSGYKNFNYRSLETRNYPEVPIICPESC